MGGAPSSDTFSLYKSVHDLLCDNTDTDDTFD
jgi:hypothetical protein